MRLTIDMQADAAYVHVLEQPVARSKGLDEQRILDFNESNDVVGIEGLSISLGVDLRDLPFREQLSKLLTEHNIRQFA
jgi:uncharacterized protein YuzE